MKLIGILIAGVVASVAGAAPRIVNVELQGPDGPLANFPVKLYRPQHLAVAGQILATDAEGKAAFQIDTENDQILALSPVHLPRQKVEPPGGYKQQFNELNTRWEGLGLPQNWMIDVPESSGDIKQTINVPRGVAISCTLTGDGFAIGDTAFLRVMGIQSALRDLRETGPALTARGIPANTVANGFIVISRGSGAARCVCVKIPSTDHDINLGEIHVDYPVLDAKIDVRAIYGGTSDPRPYPVRELGITALDGVTLISFDGSVILSMILGREVPVVEGAGIERGAISVPHGTYYVLPRLFRLTPAQKIVVDKLKAGQDLSASGIPKVSVAAGETKSVEMNYVDTLNAVFALPGLEK